MDTITQKLVFQSEQMFLNRWLAWQQQHPLATWFIHHPIITFVILLMILFLLAGLVQAVGRIFENFWLKLLSFPGWLTIVIFRRGTGVTTELLKDEKQRKRSEVLAKLQAIKREQDSLIQELERLI